MDQRCYIALNIIRCGMMKSWTTSNKQIQLFEQIKHEQMHHLNVFELKSVYILKAFTSEIFHLLGI